MFYFLSFHGDKKSLLYYFYLASYKILLGYYEAISIDDVIPLHNTGNRPALWMHDFIAPFHQYFRAHYSVKPEWADSQVNPAQIRLAADLSVSFFSVRKNEGSAKILISENEISQFSFESEKAKIWAQKANI
jgi:hypothetical protein